MQEKTSIPKYQLATIYEGLRRLLHHVRKLQLFMTKTDRQIYGNQALQLITQCIEDFIIAFDFQEERPHYYMRLVGKFHALSAVVDEIDKFHLLKTPKNDLISGKDGTLTSDLTRHSDKLLLQIFEEIGKIDEDISKWRSVALRSTNASANP